MGSIAALAPRDMASRSQWRVALLPLDSGPGEIASIDGLRAIAALSVMLFHAYYLVSRSVGAGVDVTALWNYGQSGVHLIFVRSGFLLFMPYARAMPAPCSLGARCHRCDGSFSGVRCVFCQRIGPASPSSR